MQGDDKWYEKYREEQVYRLYVYKGRWAVILNRLVTMDFTEKVIFEQRFEAPEQVNYVDIWGERICWPEGIINLKALHQECVC